MATIESSKYVAMVFLLLVCSMVLNGYFMLYKEEEEGKLSWSSRAAVEAEAVAALSCSGHGRAYLDGIIVDGRPVCECNTCFGGPDCSHFSPHCPADVNSGDPIFLEPFWMQNAASSAIVVAGWHRMRYAYEAKTFISQELETHIRRLHAIVGNAVTSRRFIVFGAGSTQLLNAAVHALSSLQTSSTPTRVVASTPYYPVYKMQTDYFNSVDYKFAGDTSAVWNNNTDTTSMNFIEFVTSPNNPDGQLKKAILHGKSVKTIYDHAYYWPHFTAIPDVAADEDLMIFTISKLTGHASSRFGWALIKDEAVYERMTTYMLLNTFGASRDTQLRALKLLKVVLEGDGSEMFKFGYRTMSDRWKQLSEVLSRSNQFSIQKLPTKYCSFFKQVRGPSPAYAWLKCEREEDEDCYEVLKAASIIGRGGNVFSDENRYVRLSLIKSQDDFDLMLQKLNMLVSKEEMGTKIM